MESFLPHAINSFKKMNPLNFRRMWLTRRIFQRQWTQTASHKQDPDSRYFVTQVFS